MFRDVHGRLWVSTIYPEYTRRAPFGSPPEEPMRKLLPVLALALAFIAPVQAGNFYVGGGFGQTSLEAGSSGSQTWESCS